MLSHKVASGIVHTIPGEIFTRSRTLSINVHFSSQGKVLFSTHIGCMLLLSKKQVGYV
uniref:Uncharacterized protein n=1 Tax=Anguilla anguilla TaxID=7936 RepID=A0A0E9UN65_ANGAN